MTVTATATLDNPEFSVLRAIHDNQTLKNVVTNVDDLIVCAEPLPGEAVDSNTAPVGVDWRFLKHLTVGERAHFISERREKPSVRATLIVSPLLDENSKRVSENGVSVHIPRSHSYLGYIFDILNASFCIVPGEDATKSHGFWEALAAGAIPLVQHSEAVEAATTGLPVAWTRSTPPFADVTLRFLVDSATNIEKRHAAGEFSRLEKCLRISCYDTTEGALIEKRSRYWIKTRHDKVSTRGLDYMEAIQGTQPRIKAPIIDNPTEHPNRFLELVWKKIEESPLKFDLASALAVLCAARKQNRALSPEELAVILTVVLHKIDNSNPDKAKFIKEMQLALPLNSSVNSWSRGLAIRVFQRVTATLTHNRSLHRRFAEDDEKSVWNARYPQVEKIVSNHYERVKRPLRILEVGAARGGLGAFLMKTFDESKIAKLVSIDPYIADYDPKDPFSGVYNRQDVMDKLYQWVQLRTKPHESRWRVLRLASQDAAWILDKDVYDIVYVDGCTTPDAIRSDIAEWSPRVAKSGALVFAEYGNEVVNAAVNELAKEWGVEAEWSLEKTGFHAVLPAPERELAEATPEAADGSPEAGPESATAAKKRKKRKKGGGGGGESK